MNKSILYVAVSLIVVGVCISRLTFVQAQTPTPFSWQRIDLYKEGCAEYQREHYEKALRYLTEFRDANDELLNSDTLSKSQIEFRDNLDAAISDCERQQPRPTGSAWVHKRDQSRG